MMVTVKTIGVGGRLIQKLSRMYNGQNLITAQMCAWAGGGRQKSPVCLDFYTTMVCKIL